MRRREARAAPSLQHRCGLGFKGGGRQGLVPQGLRTAGPGLDGIEWKQSHVCVGQADGGTARNWEFHSRERGTSTDVIFLSRHRIPEPFIWQLITRPPCDMLASAISFLTLPAFFPSSPFSWTIGSLQAQNNTFFPEGSTVTGTAYTHRCLRTQVLIEILDRAFARRPVK